MREPDDHARQRLLAEIGERDRVLNAFVHLEPDPTDARSPAAAGGRLAGAFVAVKDNIAVRGAPWACGSAVRRGREAHHGDATVVRRLRAAGAVVVGTTNLDEFAMGASTESSAWGPTRNPWDPTRTSGGSSGGSAAAVAAYGVLGVGTDTGGSIREPAAFCGVVGVAPSPGAVPMDGVVPFAPSLDRVGPLAPDVARAATLHDVLAGDPDGGCANAAAAGAGRPDLSGWRVGRVTPMAGERNAPGVLARFERAVDVLSALGADVVEVSVPRFGDLLDVYLTVSSVEALPVLEAHEDGLGAQARGRLEIGRQLAGSEEHVEAMNVRDRIASDAHEVLTRCHLMISPTVPLLAPLLGREGLDDPLARPRTDWWTVEANLAGLAAMSLPIGCHDGLPVGLQLMAGPGRDALLYRAGAAVQVSLE